MTKFNFQNKVAIVTGGASGIGKYIDGGMTRLMIYHGDNGWTLDDQ